MKLRSIISGNLINAGILMSANGVSMLKIPYDSHALKGFNLHI